MVGDMIFRVDELSNELSQFYSINNAMTMASSTERLSFYSQNEIYKSFFPLSGKKIAPDDDLAVFYGVNMFDVVTSGYLRQGKIVQETTGADLKKYNSSISQLASGFEEIIAALINNNNNDPKLDVTKIKSVAPASLKMDKMNPAQYGLLQDNREEKGQQAYDTQKVLVIFPDVALIESWLNTYDSYSVRLRLCETNQYKCTYLAAQARIISREYIEAADSLKESVELVLKLNGATRDFKYDVTAQQNMQIPQLLANGEKWKQSQVDLEEKARNYKKEKSQLLLELGKSYEEYYSKMIANIKAKEMTFFEEVEEPFNR
jgi:hypothetical protein